jgi:sporulation related protein
MQPQSMQPMQQGYHFPPPDAEPAYGYGGQQLMPAQQQWGQPQSDPRGYELAYQTYAPADSGAPPFQSPGQHSQQQGYGEVEPEYGEDYYEDEEPRRGKRWILIAVALVGAIGVGGALAYGYRSFVAPHSGRVPVVKADPNVKAKPDFRGGKEFAGAERRLPVRAAEESPAQREGESAASAEEAPAENLGPRVVRSIPIAPSGSGAAAEPAAAPAVPGITLYRPPQLPGQQPTAAAPPPQPAAKAAQPAPPVQPSRVVVGSRPQPAAEPDEEAPAAPPPLKRSVPVQTAALSPRLAAPKPASSGLGYVAVLFTEKTSMDALKKFADMQQKYTDVLVDKTPDVQEADLSDRGLGTQYRLVVGPPGSRNSASGVCAQLKSAGYSGCWVKEY